MKSWAYAIVLIIPLAVLGIASCIIAIIVGSKLLLALSILNIVFSAGDVGILINLISIRCKYIFDHPTDAGFYSVEKKWYD